MQSIGRMITRKRTVRILPKCYFEPAKRKGTTMVCLPFDGEYFLHFMWRLQSDQLWMARRGTELVAAAVDYITHWTKEPRMMAEEKKDPHTASSLAQRLNLSPARTHSRIVQSCGLR